MKAIPETKTVWLFELTELQVATIVRLLSGFLQLTNKMEVQTPECISEHLTDFVRQAERKPIRINRNLCVVCHTNVVIPEEGEDTCEYCTRRLTI